MYRAYIIYIPCDNRRKVTRFFINNRNLAPFIWSFSCMSMRGLLYINVWFTIHQSVVSVYQSMDISASTHKQTPYLIDDC